MAVAVFIGDQATKAIAAETLGRDASDHRVELLGSFLAFEYLENTGAAFGVLEGQGVILTFLAALVVAVLLALYLRSGQGSAILGVSLGLLIGGAIGNVVDRVRLGYVIDFVAVGIWPKFNVADSAITLGVILLGWYMARDSEQPSDSAVTAPAGVGVAGMRKAARHEGG